MWELRKTLLKAQTEKLQEKTHPLRGNNRIWKPDTNLLPKNQITGKNKLAFGQTRFSAAADPIEHISEENFLLQIFKYISEENFLLQIFAKMEIIFDPTSPNYFVNIISLGVWTTTDTIEPISKEKSLLKNNCKDMFLFPL